MKIFRKIGDNAYQGTTWQIKFELDNVDRNGIYKLRVALASATLAELQVKNYTTLLMGGASENRCSFNSVIQ